MGHLRTLVVGPPVTGIVMVLVALSIADSGPGPASVPATAARAWHWTADDAGAPAETAITRCSATVSSPGRHEGED